MPPFYHLLIMSSRRCKDYIYIVTCPAVSLNGNPSRTYDVTVRRTRKKGGTVLPCRPRGNTSGVQALRAGRQSTTSAFLTTSTSTSPFLRTISATSPLLISPLMIFLLSTFSTVWTMSRFSGRAPNAGSKPALAR